jgi:hypothetical protein
MIPTLDRIGREGPFQASSIYLASQCRLRLLLESERRYVSDLPDWPESKLGVVIHKAMEEASRSGAPAVSPLIRAALEDSANYVSTSAQPGIDVPVMHAVPMSTILRKIGMAQKTYRELPNARTGHKSLAQPPAPQSGRAAKTGIEKYYRSKDGHLAGRVDRWDRRPDGSIEITDFKSGRITSGDGVVRPEYEIQLYAYAFLMAENGIANSISVSLTGVDGSWSNEFGVETAHSIRSLLDELIEVMPLGERIRADDVSRIGAACTYCKYRPRCRRYMTDAPAFWASSDRPFLLPNDVWGVVTDIRSVDSDLIRLYIEDPNGRQSSISNIPLQLFSREPALGTQAYFFNLKVSGQIAGRNWPSNFFIKDLACTQNSAHAATVYLDDVES